MENIFQRPPILMRLTMLTRDKMSLLRAASLRTAWETAHGLNDRKQRGWVEAGILPLNYSRSLLRHEHIKIPPPCPHREPATGSNLSLRGLLPPLFCGISRRNRRAVEITLR